VVSYDVWTARWKINRAQAILNNRSGQATVTSLLHRIVLQKDAKQRPPFETGQLPTNHDPISSNDPTMPPGQTRSPTYG